MDGGGDLYPGGLISGIISLLANGWAYIWGGLEPRGGGALTWDFKSCYIIIIYI